MSGTIHEDIIEWNNIWVRHLSGPVHLGLKMALFAPYSVISQRSPISLAKYPMAPNLSILMSSGSKKKESTYICLGEAKTSHSFNICTELSSSVSDFLEVGYDR